MTNGGSTERLEDVDAFGQRHWYGDGCDKPHGRVVLDPPEPEPDDDE